MRKVDAIEVAASLLFPVFTTVEAEEIAQFLIGDSLGRGRGCKRLRALENYGLVRQLFPQRPNVPAVWMTVEVEE